MKLLEAAPSSTTSAEGEKESEQHVKIRKKVHPKPCEEADDPISRQLQLLQSINRFNKEKHLRRTITRDKSVPNFDYHLLHQMAIKSFDKSKLKSVGMLEQSRGQVPDTGCSGEFADDADDTAAPPRTKLLQRRHTLGVALPAEGSDSGSAADTALPQARHCPAPGSRHCPAPGSRHCPASGSRHCPASGSRHCPASGSERCPASGSERCPASGSEH